MNDAQVQRFLDHVYTLDFMIKIILSSVNLENVSNVYNVMVEMFSYFLTGRFTQPLFVYRNTVSSLSTTETDGLLLPKAEEKDPDVPCVYFPDARFFNYYTPERKILVDYFKFLKLVPEGATGVDLFRSEEAGAWAKYYWQFLHALTVAVDKYLNEFWGDKRGTAFKDIENLPEYSTFKNLTDSVLIFFKYHFVASIPCGLCKHHYLQTVGDLQMLKTAVGQPRLVPSWTVSDFAYQLHNAVNIVAGKPYFSPEEFEAERQRILEFLVVLQRSAADRSNALIPVQKVDWNLTFDGSGIGWF